MANIYYWAEMNSGDRFPTATGTVYVKISDMQNALIATYGTDEVEVDFYNWELTYGATASGLQTTTPIEVSGINAGTGFRVEIDSSLSYATEVVATSEGWSDFVTSNSVSLS